MKRIFFSIIACSISVALHAAASSSGPISLSVVPREIPASTLRILSMQLGDVGSYQGFPAILQEGFVLFREAVQGKRDGLQDSFEVVQEKFARGFTYCASQGRAKISVYLATRALLAYNQFYVLNYAQRVLALPIGSFLPIDKLSAYCLLVEFLSRFPEFREREALVRVLDHYEEHIVSISKLCDQEAQNEFLYGLARKFWFESSYNLDQRVKAFWCLNLLKSDQSVTGSLRCDVEQMLHSIEHDGSLLASLKPPVEHPVLKKKILEPFSAETETQGSTSPLQGASSSSGQSVNGSSDESRALPSHENTALESTNIKRIERTEAELSGSLATKRQRKKVTNTLWYCATCDVFLASEASFAMHPSSVKHIKNAASGAL